MGCRNPQSCLQTRCRMYRPSFKHEWVGVRVWGALHVQRAAGQARGTFPWGASGRFPGLLGALVAECHRGREDTVKSKTSFSFQTLHILKRELWVNHEGMCIALPPVWPSSGSDAVSWSGKVPGLSPRAPELDCVGPNPYQPCDLRHTSPSLVLLFLLL